MPTKPTHVEITSVGSQSDRRTLATFRDQHKSTRFPDGRPWWSYIERPSDPMMPPGTVAELVPGDHETAQARDWSQSWSAPWMPGAKYMELNPRRMTVYINYPRMIADFKVAMEDHYRKATEIAYEKNWPEPQWLGAIDHNITHVIGKIPMSHKIPEAAMAGDPWILGFAEEPNEKLARILDLYNRQSDMWDDPEELGMATLAASTPMNLDELIARKVAEQLAFTQQAVQAAPKKAGGSAEQLAAARAAKAKHTQAGAIGAPAMG